MADVFLSYSKVDKAWVQLVARALNAAGLSCWFDEQIEPDSSWRAEIERELESARCVLVLWTPSSVKRDFVISECERARRRNKLIQCMMEPTEPPLGFDALQYHDLVNWSGASEDPRWARTLESVKGVLSGKIVGAPQGTALAGSSRAANAWAHIARSVDPIDYNSFIERYPDDPLTKFAKERLDDLSTWARVDKSSTAALKQFILEGPFDRLIEEAQAALPNAQADEARRDAARRQAAAEEEERLRRAAEQRAEEERAASERRRQEQARLQREANLEESKRHNWANLPIFLPIVVATNAVLILPFGFLSVLAFGAYRLQAPRAFNWFPTDSREDFQMLTSELSARTPLFEAYDSLIDTIAGREAFFHAWSVELYLYFGLASLIAALATALVIGGYLHGEKLTGGLIAAHAFLPPVGLGVLGALGYLIALVLPGMLAMGLAFLALPIVALVWLIAILRFVFWSLQGPHILAAAVALVTQVAVIAFMVQTSFF